LQRRCAALGWIDRQNIMLKPRFADLSEERLAALARCLAEQSGVPRPVEGRVLRTAQELNDLATVLGDQLGRCAGQELTVAFRRRAQTRRDLGDTLPHGLGGPE